MVNKNLVLFDIDGTIADDTHRVEYAVAGDWATYFNPALVIEDDVLTAGLSRALQYRDAGWEVGYLTARRHVLRHTTEAWMDIHGFPVGRLIMKEWEETRTAANYKADEINAIVDVKAYNRVVLFEDDPEIVKFVNETTEAQAVQVTWYTKHPAMVKSPTL